MSCDVRVKSSSTLWATVDTVTTFIKNVRTVKNYFFYLDNGAYAFRILPKIALRYLSPYRHNSCNVLKSLAINNDY